MDGKHLGARKDFKLDVRMCVLQIFPEFLCQASLLMVGIDEHVQWLLAWLKVVLVLLVVGWKKQLKEGLRCTSGSVGVCKTNFPISPDPSWENVYLCVSHLFFLAAEGCNGMMILLFFRYEHILSVLKIL